MTFKQFLAGAFFYLTFTQVHAQNLDSLMAADDVNALSVPVTATFKTTRLVNLQTIEQVKQGELDFRITHRFDDIAGAGGGITTLYGLDNVTDIRIAFDYGVKDWWTVGFGRSKGAYERRQIVDLNSKIKLITQKQSGGSPLVLHSILLLKLRLCTPRQTSQALTILKRMVFTALITFLNFYWQENLVHVFPSYFLQHLSIAT